MDSGGKFEGAQGVFKEDGGGNRQIDKLKEIATERACGGCTRQAEAATGK